MGFGDMVTVWCEMWALTYKEIQDYTKTCKDKDYTKTCKDMQEYTRTHRTIQSLIPALTVNDSLYQFSTR